LRACENYDGKVGVEMYRVLLTHITNHLMIYYHCDILKN